MILFILFSTYLSIISSAMIDGNYKECAPHQDTCEFWLTIQEQLTMIWKKHLVYPHNGKLYKYDEFPNNATTEIPIEEVVSVDGYNRMAIAINKTIPAPPLIVYEGQTMIVHVKNLLLSDSVTIHWHGLHQKGTPFMDGVGYITQCPIAAGQHFTYEFKASPFGTFWYHSHVGAQRSNGVFGALIVKERPKQGITPPIDMIMNVGDWHHHSSEEVYIKMIYGNYIGRKKFQTSETLDGGRFSGVPWNSALIEGKGRYRNPKTGDILEAPLTWYKVRKGGTYRFRVIGVGTIYPFRISVDGHNITVIASDGYDVKPKLVESLIINPGERFDFLITADQSNGNYWVRANSMEHNKEDHTVEAVLHYDGISEDEPTTTRQKCTKNNPCKVVNCPFLYYPEKEHIECSLISDLERAVDNDPAPEYKEDSEEHFLNFAFPGTSVTPGAVNGRKFEFPGVNSLTQGDELGHYDCDRHDCGKDKVCYCHYQLEVPFNKTIQMIWLNMGRGAGWGHPMHMHGHSFYVLKMAYVDQNKTTGRLVDSKDDFPVQVDDVDCGDGPLRYCNEAKWKNESWTNGNIPGLNLKNPPRKDTLIIPTGGYAVIRIRSDNPGKWFIHCHIEVHALDGMAMVLSEAVGEAPKPPKGFPVCQNFYNDDSKDYHYHKNAAVAEECKNETILLILVVILSLMVVFLLIGCLVTCVKYRTEKKRKADEQAFTLHNKSPDLDRR